jgi:hypothetical protein
MPLAMCSTCHRMISISRQPGGNPLAAASPDAFAMQYASCERCRAMHCDRCLDANGGKCPGCGRRLELEGPPPGEVGELPEQYRRFLDGLEAEKEAGGARGKRERASLKPLLFWGTVAAALYGVTALTPPGSLLHTASWLGMHALGVLAVLIIAGPIVGGVATAGVLRLLRAATGESALVPVMRAWMIVDVVALLGSPAFVYQAYAVWELETTAIVYAYTAILGMLVGGILMLRQLLSRLARR